MLKNKNALVTGGSRGIGAAIVKDFARRGANVAFTYNSNAALAEGIVAELSAAHPEQKFKSAQCDVGNIEQAAATVAAMMKELGAIDILVNNAGITADGPMIRLTPEQWQSVINVNLSGAFNVTRPLVFEFMKRKSGVIINMSSIAGVFGNSGQTNYAASKSGLIGFTKSLFREVGPYGVRVNAIAPGFIDTEMTAKLTEKESDAHKKRIPLRRFGTVDEVAKVVSFLASDDASYITGQVIGIDGGLTL